MLNQTSPISRQALLIEANEIIRNHEDFLHGMEATGVEQKGDVLVFRGEFFLDEDGLPTPKTTAVFNMFKHLAHVLSGKYHLQD
ncbi:YciN family protein [Budviciaceae bacterium CWB-B4]|uniref:YciN family protein n=1 Tax=Limnobaculum xujianqingii TaxID=2738837 RepID=A0A9D7AI57_9GAMM|nr:YciN family protein [Limnobaculum xujianqingii]MBK5073143.1 YciN family protein [Limnobaculum xujianqingii]MBK5176452.1 YciN family protein [Limnobaculum xujianqingii]